MNEHGEEKQQPENRQESVKGLSDHFWVTMLPPLVSPKVAEEVVQMYKTAGKPRDSAVIAEILNKANSVYPDQFLSFYFDEKTGKQIEGDFDTLAEFIVKEIHDVYDESLSREEQVAEAVRVMERAANELLAVAQALKSLIPETP